VSFEPELAKLAALASLAELERCYAIVFVPTWQPFYSAALFHLASRVKEPFWIMPSSTKDQDLCAELGPLCRPLPFQASSWVSHIPYASKPEKSVDLLMLANFSAYKRHWRLFEAIPDMPVQTRIVLAGRPFSGRTAESLRREAAAFNVSDRFEIHENPSDAALAGLLASSRVLCALSHREGSYIAVAESLMADTPVAIFSNAVVGSKEYIRRETGFLLDPDAPLAPQLTECIERSKDLHPGPWAADNISAEANFPRFNELLSRDSTALGGEWTRNMEPFFCRHFDFHYHDASAELRHAPEYEHIRMEFGLDIKRPALDGRE
jgi:hypothetical protein